MYCSWWAPQDRWPPFPTPFKGCSLHWGALILRAAASRKRLWDWEGFSWGWLAQCSAAPGLPGRSMGECPAAGGSAKGGCPHLAPPCFPQLHIVHINVKYRTLVEAKGHPNGLAVLGFFFQVGLRGSRCWREGNPWKQAAHGVAGGALYSCPEGARRGRKAGSRPEGAGEPQW